MMMLSYLLTGIGLFSCCAMNCAFFLNRNLVVKPDGEIEELKEESRSESNSESELVSRKSKKSSIRRKKKRKKSLVKSEKKKKKKEKGSSLTNITTT